VQDYVIFDFATEYAANHKTIASPDKFVVSDEIYNDFHRFLAEKKFSYESRSEQTLKNLIETAKRERYYDAAQNEFTALEKGLTLNLDLDLGKFSEEIRELLKDEIVSRYYYQKGAIIASLANDHEIRHVLTLFHDPAEFGRILLPASVKTGK